MTQPISLLLGVHAHQPVGNFESVLDEAHERCYRPFLRTLFDYPEFRFAAHFSGWLLERLMLKFPRDLALLQQMVARGQVELFGGGDCEPVLAAIPCRDRLGQIEALNQRLRAHFGTRPSGAWLTERVYIPTVVPALADCGLQYITVDDYHFLCVGKSEAELDGYYTTEEDDRRIDLFPISEALRYRLPFSPAAEAVSYLEGLAREGRSAAVYFDDIEKFGIWPETYAWVYEKAWLRQFIEGVLASPLIRTQTYRDYHEHQRTRGIIYLPTTSYIEMNEWTLPPHAAAVYADLVAREKAAGTYALSKAFVRGGIWKNFFMRYPEANWMHKRMLGLSQRLAALPAEAPAEVLAMLYRAQANDAYWHGLFGGLYLPHLRRVVWRNLLDLERALDQLGALQAPTQADLDSDGHDEVFLRNAAVQAVIKLDHSGALCEFDARALCHNFGDTLTQRHEHYYHKLSAPTGAGPESEGIASAHDRVAFRHEVSRQDIVPDARPRRIGSDSWIGSDGVPRQPAYLLDQDAGSGGRLCLRARIGGGVDGGAEVGADHGEILKTFTLGGAALTLNWRIRPNGAGRFQTELNLALPSCDGYSGRYILEDGSIPCGFGQTLALESVRRLRLDDRELGGGLCLLLDPPARLQAHPHHTVSQSEAGFEKIMQAACLELSWPITAALTEIHLRLEVQSDPLPPLPEP
ncbi:MAG: DUF1926 domain-containing protein [Betaproteobacteria bacterium]|nr:DUF1926 domain-containing protein [Betaproteobacteria bacterium]